MKFQVWLNDSRMISSAGTVHYWTDPSIVTVEANDVRVNEVGELTFYDARVTAITTTSGNVITQAHQQTECFARGQWIRWKLSEEN